jgi:hypothetical protein
MMNLGPYLPPVAGDVGSVFALLQVIQDPKQATKALEKIVAEKRALDDATEKQRELHAELAAKEQKERAELAKIRDETDRLASKAAGDFGAATAALAHAERAKQAAEISERKAAEMMMRVEEREHRLESRERELDGKMKRMQEEAHKLVGKFEVLEKRENEVHSRETMLAQDLAEHNAWLAGLKPPRAR